MWPAWRRGALGSGSQQQQQQTDIHQPSAPASNVAVCNQLLAEQQACCLVCCRDCSCRCAAS